MKRGQLAIAVLAIAAIAGAFAMTGGDANTERLSTQLNIPFIAAAILYWKSPDAQLIVAESASQRSRRHAERRTAPRFSQASSRASRPVWPPD